MIQFETTKGERNMQKKIEEIFNDYKTNSNIKYAQVESFNILKKTNTLQVILSFDEYIEIKDIWNLENFLKERFQFEHLDIQIHYHEKVEKKSIQEEWKNIISYMSHTYPLATPMLLLKSNVEVENKSLKIELHIKGAEFLKAKKVDKELQKAIKNLFDEEYKIEITEKISLEDLNEIKQNIKAEEEKVIAHINEENMQEISETPKIEEEKSIPEPTRRKARIHFGKIIKSKRKTHKNKGLNCKRRKSNLRRKSH